MIKRALMLMACWLAMTAADLQVCEAQSKALTAAEIIAQIQQHVGILWMKDTVDNIKAGDPNTPVTGIATTMMATLDVLQRAAANHQNLIITHEPTFYNHVDRPEGMAESDAVWAEKRAFIEKHHLVVWRFHDHWHRMKPDGIFRGWSISWAGKNIRARTIPICSPCRRPLWRSWRRT